MSSNDKDEESLKRYYELYDEIEDSIKEAYKKGVYLGSLSQIKAIKKGVAHIYGEEGNISVKDAFFLSRFLKIADSSLTISSTANFASSEIILLLTF